MPTLTPSEKRTVLYGSIGIGVYLLLFGGYQLWGGLQKRVTAYHDLVAQAAQAEQSLKPYADRILVTKKLLEQFHLDPAKLNRATLMGEASAQLQKTAASSGLGVGAIRETPAKNAAKEMATLQLEGSGPVAAILGLFPRLESLGFPVVVDSVQITADPMRPGNLKLVLSLVILDFDQWKPEAKPHA